MRTAAVTLLLGACSFDPSGPVDNAAIDAAAPSVDGAPGQPDAPDNPPPPPPPPDAPAPQVTCTTSDSALHLCLEFEDATLGTAIDGSTFGHDATITGGTVAARDVPVDSRAIGLAAGTSIMIAATSDLDLQNVTIGAWVKRVGLPSSNQQFGIIDIGNRQAAVAIDSAGRAVCMVRDDANVWIRPGGTTASGEWAFVACTFDNPDLCTYVFRNGSATANVSCGQTDGDPINTSGNVGAAIGSLIDSSGDPTARLPGAIDAVRVYSRVLDRAEICQSAGLTGC